MPTQTNRSFIFNSILALAWALGAIASASGVELLSIDANGDFAMVERALAKSAEAEAIVVIAPGSYTLVDTFHVDRSRVSIIGNGDVTLHLADGVNRPVISIGTRDALPLEEERISGVYISGITIEGNRENQSSERDAERPWIRNNGIDARCVTGLTVRDVEANGCRSGGLVISWGCTDVIVENSSFQRNYYDGVAYYDSRRVYTVDCEMRFNRSAGISLDNGFSDSLFLRCSLVGNGDVGVFARHSSRLLFDKCVVSESGDWAFFLAHDEMGKGVHDTAISRCAIFDNDGGVRMASVNSTQSSRNSVLKNEFRDNARHGRGDLDSAGSKVLSIRSEDTYSAIETLAEKVDANGVDGCHYLLTAALVTIGDHFDRFEDR